MPNVEIDGTNSTVKTDKLTSQSGTAITVPTGKVLTVTDAAGLTVAGSTVGALDTAAVATAATAAAQYAIATQVPPSTSGKVLTSNGSAWTSATPAGGGSDHTAMIGGLTTSNPSSSATVIGISTGIARDYGDAVNIVFGSAYTKTTGAWAVGTGNGGLDTGSVANNSGYGIYLIRNSSTSVVDILISLDKTANMATATKPSGFDQWRLIGWFRTKGSANIMPFTQFGDYIYLAASSYYDFNDSSITSNSYETVTTTAPPRANVYWHLFRDGTSASGGDSGGFSIRPGDGVGYGDIASDAQNFYWNAETAPWGDGMDLFTHCPTDAQGRVQYALHSGSPGSEVMKGEILEVNLVTRSHPVAPQERY